MRIEIEQLQVKVTRDDGAVLTVLLTDDGLITVVSSLTLTADEAGVMELTIPFEEPVPQG